VTDDVGRELHALRERLEGARPYDIGFPGAVDVDYGEVLPMLAYPLNNVGDPYVDGIGSAHTKHLEREVVEFFADLFRAPEGDRWGYVTTGGTDGNEYGLHLARSRYPDGVVYHSEAAHYSIAKLVERLRMPAVAVRADDRGELDYARLGDELADRAARPAIVVATAGTTMTEAVDDVRAVTRVAGDAGVRELFVHTDAALAGVPLALLAPWDRSGLDLADGADCVAVSGHKFLGTPFPCGVVLTRRSLREGVGRPIDYVGTLDSTVGGSRSGHAPLLLWHAVRRLGRDGLRARAEAARRLAAYAVGRLTAIGWPAWRFDDAFTVVLPTPPAAVLRRWPLASSGGRSHIVCMPGVTAGQIDRFADDLARAGVTVPHPRAAPTGATRGW
jgi:histidine decarboxylase